MPKTVVLGERQVPLPRFSVFKATEAIGLASEIMAAYPELLDRLVEHRDRHAIDVPVVRDGEIVLEDGKPLLERQLGSAEEAFASIFPDAYRLARGKVLDLLSLVVTANDALEDADLAGLPIHRPAGEPGADWATKDGYRAIAHAGEIQQLVTLCIAAKDVLRDQLQDADPQTRALIDPILARLPRLTLTSPPSAPANGSSTGSPASTPAGRARKSSTGSRGATRSASLAS
jgi:hypothetical protein